MEYKRLPFAQYFIDTCEDRNNTGKASRKINYKAVPYNCNALEHLLGINHEVNYDIWYDASRDVIQINFEKTNGMADWFANIAEVSAKYYDAFPFEGQELTLRVHHGWGRMYLTIKREIRSSWQELHELHPDAETEVIGWSLGSGQAMLCAQDLNFNFGVRTHLFTYGSVCPFRSANKELLHRYLDTLCSECWNFANVNDIVTYLPPFWGFTMIRRVNVGEDEKVTLRRLLNPNYYHTIYDREELYTQFEIDRD